MCVICAAENKSKDRMYKNQYSSEHQAIITAWNFDQGTQNFYAQVSQRILQIAGYSFPAPPAKHPVYAELLSWNQ
jgi:hypothetical protein